MRAVATLFRPTGRLPAFSSGYSPEWADRLLRGLRRHTPDPELVVVTDYEPENFEEPVQAIEFVHRERGWASLMEMFRPDVVGERAILVGLDTVIVGDLADIDGIQEDAVFPRDPYHAPALCNALVSVSALGAETIWDCWQSEREEALDDPQFLNFGAFSEMLWMRERLEPDAWLDDLVPGQVVSYKVHCGDGLPLDARVVYFHGRPKPQDVHNPWMQEHWR